MGAIALAIGAAAAARAQQTSFETLNVCGRIPATAVAVAISGRVVDERPINPKGLTAARCVYGIELAGARHAFVVWVSPAGDFEGLRAGSDAVITDVKGVGDEAFATIDSDTKRVQLTARLRGKVTVQVTSDRMDWAQAIAKVALSKF